MNKVILAAAAMIAFVGTTGVSHAEADLKKGAKVFKKCKLCHDVGTDKSSKMGPMLTGVVGRKAAAQEGYSYSKALKEAGEKGLVWSEEELDKFLTKPKKYLPGTNMAFPGLKKEKQRANVIGYLKSVTK